MRNQPLIRFCPTLNKRSMAHALGATIASACLFTVAIEGGNNIFMLFQHNGNAADDSITFGLSIGTTVIYTLLNYHTLKSLSLRIKSRMATFFSILAPLTASAFFTAGTNGANLLKWNSINALSVGLALFVLRLINCIDAAIKFPHHWFFMQKDWRDACRYKNSHDIVRLIVTNVASVGYAVCATDAIDNTIETILKKFIRDTIARSLGIALSIAGAIGTLPSNIELIYRGVKQLTFGGYERTDENPDPTDRYTYFSLLCLLPLILGILGEITASNEEMFGEVGSAAQAVRVFVAILYTVFVGTPLLAPVLRAIGYQLQEITSYREKRKASQLLQKLLPSDEESKNPSVDNSKRNSIFDNQSVAFHEVNLYDDELDDTDNLTYHGNTPPGS